MSRRIGKWTTFTAILLAAALFLSACGGDSGAGSGGEDPEKWEGTIRIAAQNFNEPIILAHMAKILIEEKTGLTATVNADFTGESVIHSAIMNDEVDMHASWTGTQLTGVLRYDGPKLTSREAWEYVKNGYEEQFDLTWLEPFGFNNTYIMTVREETAKKYNLKKQSDLADLAPNWLLGGDDNFDTREIDGYPGWSKAYGIEFKDCIEMQYGLLYRALAQDEIQVAAAYATDARIVEMNLVTLEDDKEFFPPYDGAYVIRLSLLEKYPGLKDILESVSGKIPTEKMQQLNYRFDIQGDDPADIARDFLEEEGLI